MITHTIIAKNTTSGTITFPDLGGFYVVASGTETLSDHFKNQYLETSTDLAGSIQSGDIVINDGEKDLTVQQGLFHVKDLSFQKILEYLAGLTVVGLADTPNDYSETKYFRSTASGTEWITLTDLFYDKTGIDTISGTLQTIIDNLNLVDLIDIPDDYDEGNYLKSTVSGTEWSDIPQSGIGTVKHYHTLFYHDESHPHAVVEGAIYVVLTNMVFLGTNSTPVNTIKLALSGDSDKDDCNGSMQIYDLTNNNEIIEFGWSGMRENIWEIVTASGMSNLPTTEAIFELRTKSTNGKKSYLTHMFIY
jgi:hypothetical protein